MWSRSAARQVMMVILMMMIRWLNITALSVSSDSTRLLVCLSIMILEIELLDTRDIRDREREGRLRMFRQIHLPQSQALDPIVNIR